MRLALLPPLLFALSLPAFSEPVDPARAKIGNFIVHTEAYEIQADPDEVLSTGSVALPASWSPSKDKPLDEALPFAWPDQYLNQFKQPFAPWIFWKNALGLCQHYERTKSEDTKAIMVALYKRFLDYSEVHDGQRFVMYRFDLGYRNETIKVATPWTSAYASGAALVGLTALAECAQIEGAVETAEEVLAGLSNPIDPRERPRFWVSFVDEDGYLWFEERPLDQNTQPRILNGHIRALTGIYEYWAHTKSDEALKLLRAGIKTVEQYAPDYRIAGDINRYDLLEPAVPDYGPKRTISQQDILFKMTSEPVFARYRDVFDADMRDDIEKEAAQKAAKSAD